MRKHPPNRRGISFEVGAQLEARDRLKNWYFLFHDKTWMTFFVMLSHCVANKESNQQVFQFRSLYDLAMYLFI